jgi:hypothetical protein
LTRDVAVDLFAAEFGALRGGLLVRERAFALLAILAEIDYISHIQALSDIATTTNLLMAPCLTVSLTQLDGRATAHVAACTVNWRN